MEGLEYNLGSFGKSTFKFDIFEILLERYSKLLSLNGVHLLETEKKFEILIKKHLKNKMSNIMFNEMKFIFSNVDIEVAREAISLSVILLQVLFDLF